MRLIEKYIQVVRMAGLNTNKDAYFGGNVTIAGTLTAGSEVQGAEVVTSSSANAFAVGQNGITNPAFNVDASTASSVTGLTLKSAASTGGVTLTVTSSGATENLTVIPKGTSGRFQVTSDTNRFGAGATGATGSYATIGGLGDTANVYLTAAGTATDVGVRLRGKGAGAIQIQDNIAVPAGGSAAVSARLGTSGPGIFVGSGAPSVSAPQGSLYLRTDGSSISTRAYINTDGATTWTNLVTAA